MNKSFGCALVLGLAMATSPMTALACGGCFAPPEINQVVTDHRMVMAVHADHSILWDQIRYTGNPAEFAWVLPVNGEIDLQVANGDFFTQLDQATTVTVRALRLAVMPPVPL